MSEIVKSEYNALDENGNYKTHYFKTSADLVEGLANVATSGSYNDLKNKPTLVTSVNNKTGNVVVDLPVGHMYWSVEPNVPTGRLPASGAVYNRPLYQGLYNWADERGLVISESEWQAIASANGGNCAYYSSGDGRSTFRVPCIKCWVKGASSVDEVGSYLEAGVPNVKGTAGKFATPMASSGGNQLVTTGALYSAGYSTGGDGGGGNYHNNDIGIDASRCSPVYRDDIDTVQPPSLVGMWLIVAFGVAHNVGEADVANVMQAVEQVQTQIGTKVFPVSQGGTGGDNVTTVLQNLGASSYDLTGRVTTLYSNSNGISDGDITLSQAYTNFKALCIVFGSDYANTEVNTHIVSVWELQQRKARGGSYALFGDRNYWFIKSTSTTTQLVKENQNSMIYYIYGIK